jgi:hypothetical protein
MIACILHRPSCRAGGKESTKRAEPSRAALRFGSEPKARRMRMGKGCLLWAIGVPIPVIIVLYLIFGR